MTTTMMKTKPTIQDVNEDRWVAVEVRCKLKQNCVIGYNLVPYCVQITPMTGILVTKAPEDREAGPNVVKKEEI